MNECTAVIVEASGIQDYIFGSNELIQNIGASELVTQSTTEWLFQVLDRLGLRHNVDFSASGSSRRYVIDSQTGQPRIRDESIETGLDVEVVYASGGKAIILFRDVASAKKCMRQLTAIALRDAPGLALVAARRTFEWEKQRLWNVLNDLSLDLERRKSDRRWSVPLSGLGVTSACAFSGLPAVDRDPTNEGTARERLVASSVLAKINAWADADGRLRELLNSKWPFVYDFDVMRSMGQSSYLAVIHTDGNDMGERFKNIAKRFKEPNENATYAKALRDMARSVNRAAIHALRTTITTLMASRDEDGKFGGVVPTPIHKNERTGESEFQIPFRPIVFGGDDVTFVCEGRLGLTLAERYLRDYSAQLLDDKEYAHARGGVAVVHLHYPFSRAYDLADDLAKSAKRYLNEHPGEKMTVLDWHFAVSGLVRPLNQVRAREYETADGKLYLRPYRLTSLESDLPHAWNTFINTVQYFKRNTQEQGEWVGKQNKLKGLREVLRAGPVATERFLELIGARLIAIPRLDSMKTRGWQGGECGYFDALEALEFFVSLEKGI
jgi:hypothetical protein